MKFATVSIAVVDDHTLFREGLIKLLGEYNHLKVLFDARNGVDMQQKMEQGNIPDVLLLDINMPLMDGPDTLDWINARYPQIKTLALSMYEDDMNIIRMVRKGARGYILKESTASELMHAIDYVFNHEYFINDLLSGRLIKEVNSDSKPKNNLTARETIFLQMCCSELTYKEIADQMSVSPRTVDGYRDQLLEKLNLKSRVGLVLYAIKNGIYKESQ